MLFSTLLIIHIIKEMDAVQLSPGERNYCAEYHIAVSVLFYFIALLIVSFCLPPSYFYSLSYCSPQSPIKAQLRIFSRYVSTGCSLNIVGFFSRMLTILRPFLRRCYWSFRKWPANGSACTLRSLESCELKGVS